jgi:5-methyltetrahydrofolate--homocysteine methyltransferase
MIMDQTIQDLYKTIINGNTDLAEENVKKSLDAGNEPIRILNEGMTSAMAEVGERFERGELFVPEMLIAALAMEQSLSILKPHLHQSEMGAEGKVVICTVKGDLHDIGKNLVGMMLESAGFELLDLGTDVPAESIVKAVRENGADIVALSALLTTTMVNMKNVIDALRKNGCRDKVKVIVGGAPVTKAFANEIGADGYAEDASRAVKVSKLLIQLP